MTITAGALATIEQAREALAAAGATGTFHARHVGGGAELALDADAVQVAASTYKVAVLLEVACQAVAGELSLTRRVRVPGDVRSPGPSGISSMLDEVELSVRDLALLMMQVSDNTATDVLQEIVGTARIAARLDALGIRDTTVRLDCAGLIAEIIDDLDGDPLNEDRDALGAAVAASPALAGTTGNTTTARDMTTLLSLIWRDEAGPPEACEEVRRVMLQQYAPHRLSTAYRDGPKIAGKTGTFYGGVRNEVGVVDFGDGEEYAVAIFLRQHEFDLRDGRADAAIGAVARLLVDHLRSTR
ncbi:serine hydrolase [Nonomuraea deserti]|nr:serine hydrolase [Nonomuraea deserti]